MNFTLGRRLKDFVKIQFFFKTKKIAEHIEETVDESSDDKYGIRKIRYDNGGIKAELHIRNGRLHGQANLYYESGKIKAKEFYRDNMLQGTSRWYYESGNLQSEKYFDEGKHIYTKEYDKEGRLVSENKF